MYTYILYLLPLIRNGIGSFAMRRLVHTFAKGFTSKAQLEEVRMSLLVSVNMIVCTVRILSCV